MSEYVRNRDGKILGVLKESSRGVVATDPSGHILCEYYEYEDVTRDPQGRILGDGDLTRGLIYSNDEY